MMFVRLAAMVLACALVCACGALLCACGNPGSPLPPSLMLPEAVTDLRAERTGNVVSLHWTMPRRTTDRLLLKGDQQVELCRALDKAPCRDVGRRLLQPSAAAEASDILPPELSAGAPHLLRYEVRLENRLRRSAGASNPAWVASGAAPPQVHNGEARVGPQGIELTWQTPPVPPEGNAAAVHLLVRLERERILAPSESSEGSKQQVDAGVPQPPQQTLEAAQHLVVQNAALGGAAVWQPEHTVDADAQLNRQYRYAIQLVRQDQIDGHLLETRGLPAGAGVVTARDVFPPAVPAGLAAVADAQDGTIDLSWTPNADVDLAGYVVYRRQGGTSLPAERVSGKDLLPTANWSDTHASRGTRYLYSVSAVDASGNESARSAEASEALP